MKNRIEYALTSMVLPILVAVLPMTVNGQDEEVEKEIEIRELVAEARESAKMWADRVRDFAATEERKTTYIGVVIESVPSVLRDYVDIPKGVGLLLAGIAKDGPAEKAGLQDNDILIKFDDQLIVNYSQFSTLLEMKNPGDTVPVTILRKGEEMHLEVTLEERIRKGMRLIHPDAPHAPPAPPVPPDVGAVMEQIDEWIPGSVRVFIDENEQVHVDLDALKNDLKGLRTELRNIHILDGENEENIIMKHGEEGARTTIIRISDKNLNYVSDDGRVEVSSLGEDRYAKVWDENDEVLYDGPLNENYAEELPDKAVKLIDELESIKLDTQEVEIKVEMHTDHLDPVTMVIEKD